MNIILLSGGSGKRLWPLSNDVRSKQFIKFLPAGFNGHADSHIHSECSGSRRADTNLESMLQRVYKQIKTVDPDAIITIATSKSQVSAIHNQLGPDVNLSVEPCRRDTFAAIALAVSYLHTVNSVPADEAVVVCPVDPYVTDDYFRIVEQMYERAREGKERLVLMGIKPTYPSEKYGYIKPHYCSAKETSTASTFSTTSSITSSAANTVAATVADGNGAGCADASTETKLTESYESLYKHSVDRAGEESGGGKESNLTWTFTEKPTKEKAKEYITQGALWNGGVFAFKISYLLEKANELLGTSDYDTLLTNYASLRRISFDYAVVEQESSLAVIKYSGLWKDLGTWNTLTEAMEGHTLGKAMLADSCSNVHVVNELNIPVLALGLSNVIISASPEGILVSDKEQSSYIKPFVDELDQQIMFAEKSWGSYRVLDASDQSLTIKVTLNPNHKMNYHSHGHRDEVWTVIKGSGKTIVDDMEQPVKVGDVVTMAAGCKHTVVAGEQGLQLIEVQLGSEISVSDKVKYDMPL